MRQRGPSQSAHHGGNRPAFHRACRMPQRRACRGRRSLVAKHAGIARCSHNTTHARTEMSRAAQIRMLQKSCRVGRLIFRYGHRRGKRCDVAAGCRRSEAHKLRSEIALLSYLEWQPPRCAGSIMRLIGSSIFVSPSAFRKKKCGAPVFFECKKLAQNATNGFLVVARRISKINICRYLF